MIMNVSIVTYNAGDLLGDGVAAAGEHTRADSLGEERVRAELLHVRLPRHGLALRAHS
jgi:hypothetical protein